MSTRVQVCMPLRDEVPSEPHSPSLVSGSYPLACWFRFGVMCSLRSVTLLF
jgi:hypothetical protein